MNSNQKGKRGERELAHWLQERGFEARRGQQFCGANGDADVEGLPGVHIECKRVEKQAVTDWLEQSISDCFADSLKQGKPLIPVVFHRQNYDHKRPLKGEWKVTMLADDFIDLYKKGMSNGA